jgi:hypothetical protein
LAELRTAVEVAEMAHARARERAQRATREWHHAEADITDADVETLQERLAAYDAKVDRMLDDLERLTGARWVPPYRQDALSGHIIVSPTHRNEYESAIYELQQHAQRTRWGG